MLTLLILNLSLILSLVVAPFVFVQALRYRKQIRRAVMHWQRPEVVLLTVGYAISMLVLLVVGTCGLFFHFGIFYQPPRLPATEQEIMVTEPVFLHMAMACLALMVAFSLLYQSFRIFLTQLVFREGIHIAYGPWNPGSDQVVTWEMISDYYIGSDYPNVVFTFIVREADVTYQRYSIRVPGHLRDKLSAYIDGHMISSDFYDTESDPSSSFLSEN